MSTPDHKMDHRAKAKKLLEESYRAPAGTIEQAGRDAIATALVHANLAVAEELKGINARLDTVIEAWYARTGGAVDAG